MCASATVPPIARMLSSSTATTGPRTATAYSFQPSNDDFVTLLLPKIASPASDT